MTAKDFQLSLILQSHTFLKDPENYSTILDEPASTFDDWFECFLKHLGYSITEEDEN